MPCSPGSLPGGEWAVERGVTQIWGLIGGRFLIRCLSNLLAPRCTLVLLSLPPGPELSGFSPRPAGAVPGAGEEFPREQLNSALAKNSPRPGPKARGGRGGGWPGRPLSCLPHPFTWTQGLGCKLPPPSSLTPGLSLTGASCFLLSSLLCSSPCPPPPASPLLAVSCPCISPPLTEPDRGWRPGPGLQKRALCREVPPWVS